MNVLTVWETRNVFGSEYVNALRGALFAEQRKQLEQCIQVIYNFEMFYGVLISVVIEHFIGTTKFDFERGIAEY